MIPRRVVLVGGPGYVLDYTVLSRRPLCCAPTPMLDTGSGSAAEKATTALVRDLEHQLRVEAETLRRRQSTARGIGKNAARRLAALEGRARKLEAARREGGAP